MVFSVSSAPPKGSRRHQTAPVECGAAGSHSRLPDSTSHPGAGYAKQQPPMLQHEPQYPTRSCCSGEQVLHRPALEGTQLCIAGSTPCSVGAREDDCTLPQRVCRNTQAQVPPAQLHATLSRTSTLRRGVWSAYGPSSARLSDGAAPGRVQPDSATPMVPIARSAALPTSLTRSSDMPPAAAAPATWWEST